jgi:oligopeptide/dipeptide ABC transporter ATP-binding protein
MTDLPLLEVRDLTVRFGRGERAVTALERVSFSIAPGEVLGLVGESGCGKSLTVLAILGLVPSPPGWIAGGQVVFEGRDLTTLPERDLEALRGERIAMIFQEPMSALNPVFTVGEQIAEVLRVHRRIGRAAARAEAVRLLARVGIPDPARRAANYPHELSGGMRQRAMIAIALACRPRLLIADEPTTALDVTIQAQILALLAELQRETGMAVLLITHDLGVVAQFARRVCVMYAGRIVEEAPTATLFAAPAHPYTEALLRSIPATAEEDAPRLPAIPGTVPPLSALPPGCRFHPRCAHARAACATALPEPLPVGPDHAAACIRHRDYALAG